MQFTVKVEWPGEDGATTSVEVGRSVDLGICQSAADVGLKLCRWRATSEPFAGNRGGGATTSTLWVGTIVSCL